MSKLIERLMCRLSSPIGEMPYWTNSTPKRTQEE
ncbi:hypothetical protein F383_27107 [Gossypium arboreum]|uniref:Uncharacterized protein n=1 Tax=Gossypium arboreum TaxID=29729 RepID=A0A0B0MWC8_GOSAR|nr:hypothetical protein F383_27107 [Gossypium arboreum]